jgi:hypothetical protein
MANIILPTRPAGPWNNEPDEELWVDRETGLQCLVIRGPSQYLCGYVAVPKWHLLYGNLDYFGPKLDVHRGVTWLADHAGDCKEPDLWWIGFDCAHLGDLVPGNTILYGRGNAVYRDFAFVKEECRRLAEQLGKICISRFGHMKRGRVKCVFCAAKRKRVESGNTFTFGKFL